jgi:hypothetical protein
MTQCVREAKTPPIDWEFFDADIFAGADVEDVEEPNECAGSTLSITDFSKRWGLDSKSRVTSLLHVLWSFQWSKVRVGE